MAPSQDLRYAPGESVAGALFHLIHATDHAALMRQVVQALLPEHWRESVYQKDFG